MKHIHITTLLIALSFGIFAPQTKAAEPDSESAIEDLIYKNKELNALLQSSYLIKDAVYADFDKDGLTDCALVLEDTIVHKTTENARLHRWERYQSKRLLILMNKNNERAELTANLSDLFKGDLEGVNWGINGDDAFIDILAKGKQLALDFASGGTLRFYERFIFGLEENSWVLHGYKLSRYDILMDATIGSNGEKVVSPIYFKECDFVNNTELNYILNQGTPSDSVQKDIAHKTIYLKDFVAQKGVGN